MALYQSNVRHRQGRSLGPDMQLRGFASTALSAPAPRTASLATAARIHSSLPNSCLQMGLEMCDWP